MLSVRTAANANARLYALQAQFITAMNREGKAHRRLAEMIDPNARNAFIAHLSRGREVSSNANHGEPHVVLFNFDEAEAKHVEKEVFHQLIEDQIVLRMVDNAGRITVRETDPQLLFINLVIIYFFIF